MLEELIRRFDTRIAIAALGSSCCAIAVARLFLGRAPDFKVKLFRIPVLEVDSCFLRSASWLDSLAWRTLALCLAVFP